MRQAPIVELHYSGFTHARGIICSSYNRHPACLLQFSNGNYSAYKLSQNGLMRSWPISHRYYYHCGARRLCMLAKGIPLSAKLLRGMSQSMLAAIREKNLSLPNSNVLKSNHAPAESLVRDREAFVCFCLPIATLHALVVCGRDNLFLLLPDFLVEPNQANLPKLAHLWTDCPPTKAP